MLIEADCRLRRLLNGSRRIELLMLTTGNLENVWQVYRGLNLGNQCSAYCVRRVVLAQSCFSVIARLDELGQCS